MKRIKAYIADYQGCGYYRILNPFKYIKGFDHKIKDVMEPEDFDEMDVMVLQRADSHQVYANLFAACQKGIKVVYDFDDHFFDVPTYNPAYNFYTNEMVKLNLESFFKTSDHLTVSTEYLKNYYSKYNPNITVLPNSIDFDLWSKFEIKYKPVIKIGWAGSPTHSKDLLTVVDVLVEILKSNPDVKLKAIGWNFLTDRRFKEVGSQLEFAGPLDVYNFGRNLTDLSIGIAPLDYNDFNRGKSNIKFLEYSVLKTPTVATDIDAYGCIEHGVTGYKIKNNDQKEWADTIQMLIDDQQKRLNIGKAAYDYIYENFNMAKNAKLWEQVYKTILI